MSFSLGNLFGSSDVPYPTGRTGASPPACGSAPVQAPEPDGFFNKLFAPKELTYPVPACPVAPSGSLTPSGAGLGGSSPIVAVGAPAPAPASGAAAAPVVSSVAPAAPTPAPASPITLVIAPWAVPAQPSATPAPAVAPAPVASVPVASAPVASAPVSSGPAPAPAAPAPTQPAPIASAPAPAAPAPAAPTPIALPIMAPPSCPAPSPEKIVTAYSLNPRLRARHPRAQEVYLEEVLEEKITARMLTKDAQPVAFVVPDGCNAVDFYTRPIELNPCAGCEVDLDLVVTVGDLKAVRSACDPDSPLVPGEQIAVTVPWRHASWVELAPEHLRLPIVARFYERVTE